MNLTHIAPPGHRVTIPQSPALPADAVKYGAASRCETPTGRNMMNAMTKIALDLRMSSAGLAEQLARTDNLPLDPVTGPEDWESLIADIDVGTNAETATLSAEEIWASRLNRFQRLEALADADEKFGAYYFAEGPCQIEAAEIEQQIKRFPHVAKSLEIVRRLRANREIESAIVDRWMRDFVHPTDDAALELLLTPAPNIEAVQFKIHMIADREMHHRNDDELQTMKVITEDIRRLEDADQTADCLSPAVRAACEDWRDITMEFSAYRSPDGDDSVGDQLCDAAYAASCNVARLPSANLEDFALKIYLLALLQCDVTGPAKLDYTPAKGDEGLEITPLWQGVMNDLPRLSAVVRELIARAEPAQ